MQVPLSWLKDYVDITAAHPRTGGTDDAGGLEVETIEYVGVEGADLVWDRDKFILARVLAVRAASRCGSAGAG